MGIGRVHGVVLAALVAAILSLFSRRLQSRVRAHFEKRPALLPVAAGALAAGFCAAVAATSELRPPLAALAAAYFLAPALIAWRLGPGPAKKPRAADFAIIAMLWLPLELAAGARWVPRHAQAFVHSTAYGCSIVLALVIFLCYRAFPGMKVNLPRRAGDAINPLAGFAVLAPVLFLIGTWLGFLPAPHWPPHRAPAAMAVRVLAIFLATALPEEILFRSLIQNLLMLRFGSGSRTLAAAAVIFGCSHLNNGPQALPNWRYAIVATLAGAVFGKVFQKSSTVLSSAALHTMVNTTKHFFF